MNKKSRFSPDLRRLVSKTRQVERVEEPDLDDALGALEDLRTPAEARRYREVVEAPPPTSVRTDLPATIPFNRKQVDPGSLSAPDLQAAYEQSIQRLEKNRGKKDEPRYQSYVDAIEAVIDERRAHPPMVVAAPDFPPATASQGGRWDPTAPDDIDFEGAPPRPKIPVVEGDSNVQGPPPPPGVKVQRVPGNVVKQEAPRLVMRPGNAHPIEVWESDTPESR
jgi:hypothetical protein